MSGMYFDEPIYRRGVRRRVITRERAQRRRSDEEEEEDDDAEEERGWQTRDYPGEGGEEESARERSGRDASRGRIKCNDVTLLFFLFFFSVRVTCTVCYR